jgi:hypothetical protein
LEVFTQSELNFGEVDYGRDDRQFPRHRGGTDLPTNPPPSDLHSVKHFVPNCPGIFSCDRRQRRVTTQSADGSTNDPPRKAHSATVCLRAILV